MEDIHLAHHKLAITLGNKLSPAQRRSVINAGLPLPSCQAVHLRSLPEPTAPPTGSITRPSYAEVRDLHCHPPLYLGRDPSSSTRVTDEQNFHAYAEAVSKTPVNLHRLLLDAKNSAQHQKVLLNRQQRIKSGVPNAGPPLTPHEEAEAKAPLPAVESGFVWIQLGGASWLRDMPQRWETVGLTNDTFNQKIDSSMVSIIDGQKTGVALYASGLRCEQDVEHIAQESTKLFEHCQQCLPPSLQSTITYPGHVERSQHNADRYWIDRYGPDEGRRLRSSRIEGASEVDLRVEDEDKGDDTFVSADTSRSWSEQLDDTSDDSIPFDVVEAAAVPPRRENVIALMELKALLNTSTEQVELLLKWILQLEMEGKQQGIQVVYDGISYRPEWKFPCAGLHVSLSHKVVQVTTYQLLSWAKDAALSDHSHTLCYQRVDSEEVTFRLSPYLAANNPIMPLLKLYLTFGIGDRDQGDNYPNGAVPLKIYQLSDAQ